jgi:phage/plasmid-like protein (TIGR03299 family)
LHALEIGSAGQVAFATRGEPAWHLLGEVFDKDEVVTTSQMLTKGYLNDWDVRLIPAPTQYTDVDGNVVRLHDDREVFYVVRDNPFTAGQVDRLSVVGGRYKVVQNESLFAFGDNLLDGGGQWETAGSIQGGRQVFGSLLLPRDILIDGQGAADRVKLYLLVHTSHDGTVGVQAMTTPVRVVCQNTLNFALRGVKQSFKMRHTQKVEGRVAAAREALNLSFAYADAFEAEAAELYKTSVSNSEFFDIVTSLYPKPENDSKAANTRWENKVGLLSDLFVGAPDAGGVTDAPVTGLNIAGTAWGALNALTERLDWYRTARDGNLESIATAASGFSPVANAEKNKVRQTVLAFAQSKGASVRV